MKLVWRRLDPGELDHELIWLLVSVGGAAFAALWLHLGMPLPRCTFHKVTGWPCPTCGATRATLQMLHGNFLAALRFNPLAVSGGFAVGLFDLYALAVLSLRLPRLRAASVGARTARALRWSAAGVLALNWLWLAWAGV